MPPPLVLAAGRAILHDGASVGLRTYPLYEYVLAHYRPIATGDMIWLDRSGPARSAEDIAVLTEAMSPRDLQRLPGALGRTGIERLEDVDAADSVALGDLIEHVQEQPTEDGWLEIRGDDPQVVYHLERADWIGASHGILVFDFDCRGRKRPLHELQVFWASQAVGMNETDSLRFMARPGRVVVPLDVAPSWYLGKPTQVRIDLNSPSCEAWRVDSPRLHARASSAP